MNLAEYFKAVKGTGVLATSDNEGNVDLAIYAKPYVMGKDNIALSMLKRRSLQNLQSNPKAAYMFVEQGRGCKGKRLYLTMLGEETYIERIKEIKERHKKLINTETAGKHLIYFRVRETRPLVGNK
jgi:hypothetical protein